MLKKRQNHAKGSITGTPANQEIGTHRAKNPIKTRGGIQYRGNTQPEGGSRLMGRKAMERNPWKKETGGEKSRSPSKREDIKKGARRTKTPGGLRRKERKTRFGPEGGARAKGGAFTVKGKRDSLGGWKGWEKQVKGGTRKR